MRKALTVKQYNRMMQRRAIVREVKDISPLLMLFVFVTVSTYCALLSL